VCPVGIHYYASRVSEDVRFWPQAEVRSRPEADIAVLRFKLPIARMELIDRYSRFGASSEVLGRPRR